MDEKIIEKLSIFSTGFVGGYVIMALSSTVLEIVFRLGLLTLFFVFFRKYLEASIDKFLTEKLLNQHVK